MQTYSIIDTTTGQKVFSVEALSPASAVLRFRRRHKTAHNYRYVVAVPQDKPVHVGGVYQGDTVTFSASEREVTGKVILVSLGKHQGDYSDISVNVDGMIYTFGTGGHLGQTWTTESGMEQWFLDRHIPA